jgi:hypothetical protein
MKLEIVVKGMANCGLVSMLRSRKVASLLHQVADALLKKLRVKQLTYDSETVLPCVEW